MTLQPHDEVVVADQAAWRAWLDRNHASADEVWVVLAKKGTTEPSALRFEEALEEALCFGWIDGMGKSRDAATSWQRFTPRRARSTWSQRNVEKAERLIAEGRMTAPGLAEVERAKADGRWAAAYAGPATIEPPDELVRALAANPRAQAMWDILTSANRYAILHPLATAKKPETVTRRIEQFVEMLARGETVHPQKRTLD